MSKLLELKLALILNDKVPLKPKFFVNYVVVKTKQNKVTVDRDTAEKQVLCSKFSMIPIIARKPILYIKP